MLKPKTTRIGCYGVITNDSKILLCRLCGPLIHAGRWTLPGGGMEFGETLEQAVMREVFEETGLNVTVGRLMSHGSRVWENEKETLHSFQFLFTADIQSGTLTHETNGTTDLVEWVEINGITDENSVDIVHRALEYLKQPC
jgi:ADP-ribose pyrophosphatase YjhB (NUDIX family)